MGTYIYTLRAKTMTAKDQSGRTLDLALFSYNHKASCVDEYSTAGRSYLNRMETLAEKAWVKNSEVRLSDGGQRVPYVVLGDKPVEGATVYTEVTSNTWIDCYDFPGIPFGYLKKSGGRWWVTPHFNEKTTGTAFLRDEDGSSVPVPFISVSHRAKDGKFYEVCRTYTTPDGQTAKIMTGDKDGTAMMIRIWKPVMIKRATERRVKEARLAEERQEKIENQKRDVLLEKKRNLLKELADIDSQL